MKVSVTDSKSNEALPSSLPFVRSSSVDTDTTCTCGAGDGACDGDGDGWAVTGLRVGFKTGAGVVGALDGADEGGADFVGANVTEDGFGETVGMAVGCIGDWVGDGEGGSVGWSVGVLLCSSVGFGVGGLVVGGSVEATGRNVGRRVGAFGLETGVGVTTMTVGVDCDSTTRIRGESATLQQIDVTVTIMGCKTRLK